MKNIPLDTIESAIEAIRLGEMIIVVDDEDRENEGFSGGGVLCNARDD